MYVYGIIVLMYIFYKEYFKVELIYYFKSYERIELRYFFIILLIDKVVFILEDVWDYFFCIILYSYVLFYKKDVVYYEILVFSE